MAGSALLLDNSMIMLLKTVAGFASAVVIAGMFAVLISEFRMGERLMYPYVVALQAMPKVAICPLILIWFGLSSKVALSALLAMFLCLLISQPYT
jgi:NitT/TauT family transport system permease protein